jgi:hypothetical protein
MPACLADIPGEGREPDLHSDVNDFLLLTHDPIAGEPVCPEARVNNETCSDWDTPNVFVTGAPLYPQNPGSNTSDTLCALAFMTGDALVDRYFRDANRLLG